MVRAGLLLLLSLPLPAAATEFLDPSHALHAWLAEEVRDGRMSPDEALLSALEAVFAPDELPGPRAALNVVPLRCATELVRAAASAAVELSENDRARVEVWLHPSARRAPGDIHVSASGRFSIEYWQAGTDSVDVTDTSPANGVPDYVESVGLALDTSWATEVDALGFDAPATGGQPYQVQLRSIGSYGYTELDGAAPGGTRIVMRSSYAGLPPNGDPEGSALGALRVTAAHEFRHAGQYATSGWSESGLWVELDATWMEDQVFDLVNDYTRFLSNSSPISDPQMSLDAGGSGSYPECVFQHWMQIRMGTDAIRQYWERRRSFPGEPVLASYDATLTAFWAPLDSVFVDFARFNLQTAALATPGVGYPEAAIYPASRLAGTASVSPASFGSAIDHLAAKFYRVDGFSGGDEEVRIRVRQPEAIRLDVQALVLRNDGARIVSELETSALDSTFVLDTPARNIVELYLVVANGQSSGGAGWFFVDVEEAPPVLPDPVPQLSEDWTTLKVATGQMRDLQVVLHNDGPASSVLTWSALAVDPPVVAARRSITGSTLSFDRLEYLPGEEMDFSLGILNGSTGFEYLSGVTLTLPSGVTPVLAEDFVGEFGFNLVWNGFDAQTSIMSWVDPDGGFGAVPGASTALGHIRLAFADSLTGALAFDWTLSGDGFGTAPHLVAGQSVLDGPANPRIEVLSPSPTPPGIIGQIRPVQWIAAGPDPVSIEVSRDDGQSWETIAASTANDGLWFWAVSGPASELGRMRVVTPGGTSAPSARFEILQPVAFASLVPDTGSLMGNQAAGLLLHVDATGLTPGDYPVRIDVRDSATMARTSVDILVQVLASAVDAPTAGRTRIVDVRPNPFNPATNIRFELAEGGPTELEVIDLRGRRVRTLLDATLPAGIHDAKWDGRDSAGAAVASGTYIYRLRFAGQTLAGKLSLVR